MKYVLFVLLISSTSLAFEKPEISNSPLYQKGSLDIWQIGEPIMTMDNSIDYYYCQDLFRTS